MSKMFKRPRTVMFTAYAKQCFFNKRRALEQDENFMYHNAYEHKESLRWSRSLKADQCLRKSVRMYTELSLISSVRSLDAKEKKKNALR